MIVTLILTLILSCTVALALFCVFMLWRNQRVYDFRTNLIAQISEAANDDIDRGDFRWRLRYEAFDAISYTTMFWQFWKPLQNFYQDMSFCERSILKEETP